MIVKGSVQQEIITHCNELSPNQACGLVLCDKNKVAMCVYRSRNMGSWPYGFHIDPIDHFNAFKKATANNWEVGGVYHCHIASEPTPSGRDLERPIPKNMLYIIVSLLDKKNPDIKGYFFQKKTPKEVNLETGVEQCLLQ